MDKGEIVLYQPDEHIKLEVRLEGETVWLSQMQMAELFQTTRNNVTMHISNIFKEGELEKAMVCKESLLTTQHGAIAGKTQIKPVNFYNDESVLLLLSKRRTNVSARIYTRQITAQLQLDATKHNSQYEPISIGKTTTFHDRFLIIDNTVYHIGASLKDLGKKLFAFSKMNIKPVELLKNI